MRNTMRIFFKEIRMREIYDTWPGTCICAVGVTSTSRGYWISSKEFRSDGSSIRTTERPSGQYTSALVATSLPVRQAPFFFCEPRMFQNIL